MSDYVYRVLLVDGDRFALQVLTEALADWLDLEIVGTATRAESALALAASMQPNVVIFEAELPGMDGLELCRELRQLVPAATLIFHTDRPVLPEERERAGADAIVRKNNIGTAARLLVAWIHRLSSPTVRQ